MPVDVLPAQPEPVPLGTLRFCSLPAPQPRSGSDDRGLAQRFASFAAETDKAFYQRLPFPIAVVYRKIAIAENNTQRFSLLIELFDAVIRFLALVHLSDYVNNQRQAELIADQVPVVRKSSAPSLGDWVDLFKSLSKIKGAPESRPFVEEIKSFRLDRYQDTLRLFVEVRNASFRGHGATLTEDEYALKFQEHAPKLYELIRNLGFLAKYRLIKTGPMEKDGDLYKIVVQVLMGDNPHFETERLLLRNPLDTNKVLYLNDRGETLIIDPYVILERCPQCNRPEVLVIDKLSEKKTTYLSYESGHKPAFENVDRLPVAIREAASRHTPRTAASSA